VSVHRDLAFCLPRYRISAGTPEMAGKPCAGHGGHGDLRQDLHRALMAAPPRPARFLWETAVDARPAWQSRRHQVMLPRLWRRRSLFFAQWIVSIHLLRAASLRDRAVCIRLDPHKEESCTHHLVVSASWLP
jgi:hypothetical protein